jgi:hypothetical protein
MYWSRITPENICILVEYVNVIILNKIKYIAHIHNCLYMKVIPLKLRSNHKMIQQKSINKFYALEKDNQDLLILINFNNPKYCEDPNSMS